jgi:PIN domain nuclease of toxin-antitoxin system
VNYLLDTHTLIWFLEGDSSLSKKASHTIEDESRQKYISIASLWEIGIKLSLGKLMLKGSFENFLNELAQTDIQILPISPSHTLLVSQLEFFHKDPFDRLIISKSLEDNLTVIGKDPNFPLYNVILHW